MPITFNSPQDQYGLQAAGSILGDALMQNAQQRNLDQRQQKQQGALAQALAGLQENSLDPTAQNQFLQLLASSGGNIEQGLDYLKLINSNNIAQQNVNNRPVQVSGLRKELNKGLASTILGAGQLESNENLLQSLESQIPALSGVTGYGKALIGTEEASQFDANGFLATAPAIKVFNPVGAIAVRKVELVQNKISPKSTDREGVIRGKINALRTLNNAAIKKAQFLDSLAQKYGSFDAIPDQELINFSRESEAQLDSILNNPIGKDSLSLEAQSENISNTETIFESLPSVTEYSGKLVVDTESGKKYRSDGKKWTLEK